MAGRSTRKLVAVLHADVVESTQLVQRDESIAHERIQSAFRRFSETIASYGGVAHEIRGDAVVAEFARASDAVSAAVAFQLANGEHNRGSSGDIRPELRIGISLAEVVIADRTLTGAGVVLAQRLEQLAEPGGVVVQGTVAETLPARLPFELEALGQRTLKGFEQPVRAFAVRLKPGAPAPAPEGDAHRRPKLALPDRPSIAVLPFTNMSGDPEQEYFSDGITEDILTDLSKVSGLFVIARHSSFAFKDRAADAKQVGEALGVRYILDGSVRRARDRLRINAQLLDAASGRELWAERYDGDLADVFELQDRIAENVVSSLAVTLTRVEQDRAMRKETQHLQAYDCVLRGNAYHHRMTKEDNIQARAMYEQAIRLDPGNAAAHAGLAWVRVHDFNQGWDDDPKRCMDEALDHARTAVSLDDALAIAHLALGDAYLWTWQQEQAVAEGRRAVALDPSYADGHFALAVFLTYAGHAEEAVAQAQKALRLNPLHANRLYYIALARAELGAENYAAAADAAQHSLTRGFTSSAHLLLAAAYAMLGQTERAQHHVQQHLERYPGFNLEDYARRRPYKNAADSERELRALRAAGLP